MKKTLIVVLGPTASGKTKLAVKLANYFKGEIISADSRQIYQHMDIGTGKDKTAYKNIPPHLIDIKKPNQQITLAEYQKLAKQKINSIAKKGYLPFLVGGTGLYISAVVKNYNIPQIKTSPQIRRKILSISLAEKIKLLKQKDPQALKMIDSSNPRRINRALEICFAGIPFSKTKRKNKPLYHTLLLGLRPNKSQLEKNINQRVDQMIQDGLIQETQNIISHYGPNSQTLSTLGYAEIIDYLNKKTSLDEAVSLIKLHTRQYAKRQITWFKAMPNINWVKNYSQAKKNIQEFTTALN